MANDPTTGVKDPVIPNEYREVTIRMPVVRRRMEPATVTWERRADGYWLIKVNGEDMIGLPKAHARALAEAILDEPAEDPTPVPEVG